MAKRQKEKEPQKKQYFKVNRWPLEELISERGVIDDCRGDRNGEGYRIQPSDGRGELDA